MAWGRVEFSNEIIIIIYYNVFFLGGGGNSLSVAQSATLGLCDPIGIGQW